MIQAVLFDIGGTLHTVANSEALARAFARRLIDRLAVYGIAIPAPPDAFARRLHENAEEYKLWSEGTLRELPAPKIWNEYYLRQYCVGEETLAPIAEELSFLYDYERVCNKRRPRLVETMEELRRMGMRMGIVSNIISTSFGPHMVNEYGIAEYMECIVMSSVTLLPQARARDIQHRHGTARRREGADRLRRGHHIARCAWRAQRGARADDPNQKSRHRPQG